MANDHEKKELTLISVILPNLVKDRHLFVTKKSFLISGCCMTGGQKFANNA